MLGLFIFWSLNQNKKSDDYLENNVVNINLLNKYLEENNLSWSAGDSNHLVEYSALTDEQKNAIKVNSLSLPEEINSLDLYAETIDSDNYLEYISKHQPEEKTKITGNLFLFDLFKMKLFDFLKIKPRYNNQKILAPSSEAKSQGNCGSCSAFAIVGATETQLYNKYKRRYNFSEQYMITYLNNKGCSGAIPRNYAQQIMISSSKYIPNTIPDYNLNDSILRKMGFSISKKTNSFLLNNKDWVGYFTKRRTFDQEQLNSKIYMRKVTSNFPIHQTLDINYPPIGLVQSHVVNLTPERYDACEVGSVNLTKDRITSAGMDVNPYKNKIRSVDKYFCPDDSDESNKLFKLNKLNSKTKLYFFEKYITIDAKQLCAQNKEKIVVALIKNAIDAGHPVIMGINSVDSLNYYKSGVWAPTKKENLIYEINGPDHAVYIYGYGKELNSGKEYWLIRNSWGSDWGENGSFKLWVGQGNHAFECKGTPLYFSGNLIEDNLEKYYNYNDAYDNLLNSKEAPFYYSDFEEFKNAVTIEIKKNNVLLVGNKIPEEIKNGLCVNKGKVGKTGRLFYDSQNFDKLLMLWTNINYKDCDFGAYYCDQDQLRQTISKKLDLLDSGINLGEITFKQFCFQNRCTGVEAADKVNTEILLNKSSNLEDLPDTLKKYVVVTISLKSDLVLDSLKHLPHHKYYLNDRIHYQLSLDQFNKIKLTELPEDASFNYYFGIPLNRSIVITKNYGNLDAEDNKTLFSNRLFLENTWTLNTIDKNNINFSVQEVSVFNINKIIKSAEFNFTKIKELSATNDLVIQPINPLSYKYSGINLEPSLSSKKVNANTVSDYHTLYSRDESVVLSFNLGQNMHLNDVVVADTSVFKLYNKQSKSYTDIKNLRVSYINSLGTSVNLIDINEALTDIYIFNNYLYSENQIEIISDKNNSPALLFNGEMYLNEFVNNNYNVVNLPSKIKYTDNVLSSVISGVKNGEICYTEQNGAVEFWHNPLYYRYNNYYSLINLDNQINAQYPFDILILVSD